MSKISTFIRTTFTMGDDIRDAGLTTPEDIIRYDDIAYGPDPKQQSLDVYRLKTEEGKKLPVIVSVHGGGWVYGNKERYQFYCMNLAQRGFAVVNFTYRLAPENKYPASLEDTNSVFTWILDHSKEYGFDTEHVFAVGDSAGAHNLGLYSAICTNPAYAAFYDFDTPKGFKPTAIALNCGAYSLVGDTSDQTVALMTDFLPEHGTERELRLIDVTAHITPDYPPTFFMTGTGDFLQTQAGPLAAQFIQAKVPFIFRFYGDKDKILPHVFHLNIKSEDAKLCNDEECNFFKKFM
ncbi:MAG: alpha/beta hydrolase [Clostridium sp.]|nr:alpha/beta hydrolase [Clostridium sp.]